jgi:hypothetical protein
VTPENPEDPYARAGPPFDLGFSAYDRKLVHQAMGSFGRNAFVAGVAAGVVGVLTIRSTHVFISALVIIAAILTMGFGLLLMERRRRILDERKPLNAEVLRIVAGDFRRRGLFEAEAAALRGREAAMRAK